MTGRVIGEGIISSPQGVIIFNLDRNYCYLGYTRSHETVMRQIWGVDILPGSCMLEMIGREDDRRKAKENFDRAMGGEEFILEEEYGQGDERSWWENRYAPLIIDGGEIQGVTVFVIDITRRKRIEVAYLEEKQRLESALEGTQAAFWEWNIETGETVFSERWARILGYRLEELEPVNIETWNALTHPEDGVRSRGELDRHFSGETDYYECEVRMKHRLGYWVWVLDRGQVTQKTAEGRPLMMYGTHQDITERKLAEDVMRMSRANMRAIIENTMDSIWAIDHDYVIIYTNKVFSEAFLANFGVALEAGTNILEALPDALKALWKSRYDRGLAGERFIFVDEVPVGVTTVHIEAAVNPIEDEEGVKGVSFFARDITEKKRAEEELLKMQKLESLGILAGGIAHDFNNLLGGIFGHIELASYTTQEAETKKLLSTTLETLNRATGLTRQLLTFAKGGAPVRKLEDLGDFLEKTVRFGLSGSNVKTEIEIAEDLLSCEVDREQICQVFDNLVINAKQAMPDGGLIRVRAVNEELREEVPELPPGNYVRITVEDEGTGIPQKMVSRIFDPFFTTKSSGHGLGLATSYSIIRRHGGDIAVESEMNVGSRFTVRLPAAAEGKVENKAVEEKVLAGKGDFIVMDDDPTILDVLEKALQLLGYRVLVTKSGEDAVALFKRFCEEGREIAGVLLDLTVPGGYGGKEAVQDIRRICRKTPVYVTSGYAEDSIMADPESYGFNGSISKPFSIAQLKGMLSGPA